MVGPDAVVAHAQAFLAGFPDARLEVLSVVDDGQRVAIEGLFIGTNTGAMPTPGGELPPTGRPLRLPFSDVWESEAGRITRHQVYFDQMTFLGQLGLVPAGA
jgi:predicted ester cyclase